MKQHEVTANAVFTRQDLQNPNTKTQLEEKDNKNSMIKQSNTVRAAKQKLPDPLSVRKIMVKTETKVLLQFDGGHSLVIQRGLPAKNTIDALRILRFFILVTNITIKHKRFEKHKLLGHPRDYISTIGSAEAPQSSTQDDQSLLGILETISTGK